MQCSDAVQMQSVREVKRAKVAQMRQQLPAAVDAAIGKYNRPGKECSALLSKAGEP